MIIDRIRSHWLFFVLLAAMGLFHVLSASFVPFHPDESTYIFMSSDLETNIRRPSDLAWTSDQAKEVQAVYRTINAPITRYAIGVGRVLAGRTALPGDWDWSDSWEENIENGVMPDPTLLWFARLPSLLFLQLSLLFLYLTGLRLHGRGAGLLAAFLLATNSLFMLHGRRAMTEAPLLLGITIFLWSLSDREAKPWLVGIAAAIALNAKHSGAALLPVGLLAVLWIKPAAQVYWKRALRNGAIYLTTVFALVWLINPFLWRDPAGALRASIANRADLLGRQVAATGELAPGQVLDTAAERWTSLLANLFIVPPSFAEVGNYSLNTAEAEQAYLAVPAHVLLRGLFGGALLLVLTLFGISAALLCLRWTDPDRKVVLALSLLATLVLLAAILLAIPLPWQRFVVPLTPFVALWAAFGLSEVIRVLLLQVVERLPETQPGRLEYS